MLVRGEYEGVRLPSFYSIGRANTGDIVCGAKQCVGRWTNALIEMAGGRDNQLSRTLLEIFRSHLLCRFTTNGRRQWGKVLLGVLAHRNTDKRQ